tara:strand:+ start:111 stop:1256 length:1146 start_codon:yes stop_codon:yes gene_type:complete
MAKKETKKEEKEVIKEVVDNTKEEVTKAPKGKEPKGDITKVKAKMTKEPIVVDKPDVIKIDMSKPKEEAVVEDTAVEEQAPIVEITEEEKVEEVTKKVTEAIDVAEKTGTDLPESITKLMDFMSDTGGDLNDYVKLNKDYSEMDNQTLLEEYYKQTKPHLDNDEISFLMEDSFSFDEEVDEDRDIKKKKIALKEQVANAKSHLDGLKSKYYEEIKSGSKLTNEQKEAVDFYKEQRQITKAGEDITNDFKQKTNRFFGDQFKGFEYGVGDKKFRYNVQDVDKVRNTQIDIDNFIGKFLDEDGKMSNESEYHKSLYTAMNADSIANHFYEQGKADAMKNSVANSKNVDMTPRQELNEPQQGGPKVRVIGDDGPSFKFKIKNKN